MEHSSPILNAFHTPTLNNELLFGCLIEVTDILQLILGSVQAKYLSTTTTGGLVVLKRSGETEEVYGCRYEDDLYSNC